MQLEEPSEFASNSDKRELGQESHDKCDEDRKRRCQNESHQNCAKIENRPEKREIEFKRANPFVIIVRLLYLSTDAISSFTFRRFSSSILFGFSL